MLQAVVIWLSAALALLLASTGVAVAAAASVYAEGVPPEKLLTDPAVSPLLNNPTWIALGTAANEIAVGLALVVWVLVLRPSRAETFPLRRPTAIGVAASLLVVFGLAPLAEVAGFLVDQIVQSDVTAARIIGAAAKKASTAEVVLLLFCIGVMPAIVEEAMFRGVLTAPFARRSAGLAIVVPSVMFGLFHIEPTQIAGTIVLGVGFALARLYTGSLVTCALAHGIYNCAVVLAVRYADVSEDDEISLGRVLVGALLFALGALLLRRSRAEPLSSPATA